MNRKGIPSPERGVGKDAKAESCKRCSQSEDGGQCAQARTEHGMRVHVYTRVHKCAPVPAGFRDAYVLNGLRGQKSRPGPEDEGPEQQEVPGTGR